MSNPLRLSGAIVAGLLVCAATTAAAAQRFECLVEPYEEVEVGSATPGILAEVKVDRGDLVSAGQLLARQQASVLVAREKLLRARAEFADRRVERNRELYRKQMISPHEKDELETNATILWLELAEVEEELKMRTVHSPIDGVVVERFFSAGEYVRESAIVKLAQIDPLRVEVAVPASYWGRIQVGMSGSVQWEGPVAGTHPARVTVVDRVVDAASGTLGVRLELPNPDHGLPAGTKCWVTFPID